jgi:transcriptional regulator with GAF, ATPase, and Fis domain
MFEGDKLVAIEEFSVFETNDLDTLLHKILNYAKTVTHCEAGTIYLKDDENYLRFKIFQNDTFSYEKIYEFQEPLKNMKLKIEQNSDALSVATFLQSKIISVDDIYKDSKYNFSASKNFDKKHNYTTKSLLCVPLINHFNKEVIGVLQLINKKNDKKENISFTNEDKEFISLSSYFITLSINSTQNSIKQLQMHNEELEEKVIHRTRELVKAQKNLIDQVNKDPMTGLYNRRYFNEVIKSLFSISKRESTPLSLMIIDIDDFKNINVT